MTQKFKLIYIVYHSNYLASNFSANFQIGMSKVDFLTKIDNWNSVALVENCSKCLIQIFSFIKILDQNLFSRNWFAGCVVFSNDGVLSKYWRTFFRWTDFSQPLANHVCTKIRFCQCCRSVTEEQHKRNSRKFWKNIVNNFYTFFCHFRREFVAYSIQITCGNSWSFGNCFCLYSRSSSFWRTYIHYSKTISIDNRKWGSRNNTYWLLFFLFQFKVNSSVWSLLAFFCASCEFVSLGVDILLSILLQLLLGRNRFPQMSGL